MLDPTLTLLSLSAILSAFSLLLNWAPCWRNPAARMRPPARSSALWLLWLVSRASAGRRRIPWPSNTEGAREALSFVTDRTCHAKPHAGYAGDGAVVWGLSFRLSSAAECCRACQAHAALCGRPGSAAVSWWPDRPRLTCGRAPACTMWSFCPGSSEVKNQCFAFDVHKHLRGECWLKQQRGEATRPKDPFFNHTFFPLAMRAADRASWPFAVPSRIWPGPVPERISWTSGVLAPAEEEVISAPPNDRWWERWCARHGPCE